MGASLKSRGFTLVELMVVLALVSLIALMGTSAVSAYKRADVTLYLQQLYQLAEATHRLKEPLMKASFSNAGGKMVIDAAFPHGEVSNSSIFIDHYDSPLGDYSFATWYLPPYSYVVLGTVGLSKDECREILLKIDMAEFDHIYLRVSPFTTVPASSFPLSYAVADGYCNQSNMIMYFYVYP